MNQLQKKQIEDLKDIAKHVTLLYAEDDPDIRRQTSRILEQFFDSFYVAADGEEAARIFKKERVDIVLTDINMPKKNGLELLQEINESGKQVFYIVLTAFDDIQLLMKCIDLGVEKYLSKPLDIESLVKTLSKVCERATDAKELVKYRQSLEVKVQDLDFKAKKSDEERHFLEHLLQFASSDYESLERLLEGALNFVHLELGKEVSFFHSSNLNDKAYLIGVKGVFEQKEICLEMISQNKFYQVSGGDVFYQKDGLCLFYKDEDTNKKNPFLEKLFSEVSFLIQKILFTVALQKKAEEIKNLLDNIGQGFLEFDRSYLISSNYSKACIELLGEDLAGKSILEILFVDDPDIKSVLDLLFSRKTNLKIINDILPKEVKLKEKYLKIEYRFIEDENYNDRILLVVSDVSQEKELMEKLRSQEEKKELIIMAVTDHKHFLMGIDKMREYIEVIKESLKSEKVNQLEMLRNLHTFKGLSSSFNLSNCSKMIHELENITELENVQIIKTREKIETAVNTIQSFLETTLKEVYSVIHNEEESLEKTFRIREDRIEELENKAKKEKVTEKDIFDLRKQRIKDAFIELKKAAHSVANQLDKKIEVIVQDRGIELHLDPIQNLLDSLIHLIRNSVDHGLEFSEERIILSKNPFGKLEISADILENVLRITVSDDGRGIDVDQVKNKAIEKKLYSSRELAKLDFDELVQLIFHPHFSTRDEANLFSGKGIGLHDVKTYVEELKGRIEIDTVKGVGTKFHIYLPKEVVS